MINTVLMSDDAIVDLFFNAEHPNFNAIDFTEANAEQLKEAILKDGKDFAERFPEFGKDDLWYANHFMRRL